MHRSSFTWGIWTEGVHPAVNYWSYFDTWLFIGTWTTVTTALFQVKSHFGHQLPLSCPLTTNTAPSISAVFPPGYLFSAGSYSRMVPGPLYPQQWPGMPSPTGSSGTVGLLGAGRVMPFAAMANPRLKSYPLVMYDTESGPCPKNTRTT